jgi:type II secretion system protein N
VGQRMRMWRRPLILAGYLSYAVALFALFTYLKFPSQQVRAFVLTTLSHHGLEQIRIGSIQPLLPAGLTFSEVSVAHDINGQPLELMRMPELQVQLRTLPPFAGPVRIGFEGGLYGGIVLGAVEWEHNGRGPTLGIHVDVQDIQPAAHPLAGKLGNAILDGKLTGTMSLELSSERWQDGSGRLIVQGDAGSIAGIEIQGVRLPALTYEQLAGELTLQQRSVGVKDFQIRGGDWQVDVQGKISLNERLPQSPIDLTLRVRASEALEQQLGLVGMFLKQRRDRRGFAALKISGTLEQPSPVL